MGNKALIFNYLKVFCIISREKLFEAEEIKQIKNWSFNPI